MLDQKFEEFIFQRFLLHIKSTIIIGGKRSLICHEPAQDIALNTAAVEGDTEQIQKAIDSGASINAADLKGKTALMWAASGNHIDAIKFLIRHQADIEIKNKNDKTSIMLASDLSYFEALKFMILWKTLQKK